MEAHQQDLQQEVVSRTQVMESDRNRLNAILQNMADALLVTDVTGKIQLVNPAFEDLVRCASRSLIGHEVQQVLPLPELLTALQRALAHPGQIEIARMTLADPRLVLVDDNQVATERVLKASVTVLGDRSSVICILRDITHEVEVDRMKSEFVSAVSHELRTPLTAILGFAKLIHRTFKRAIQPELSEAKVLQNAAKRITKNLEILLHEAERLMTLINDVLDIAALDAGTLDWHEQPCEVQSIIAKAVDQLRSEVEHKGLVIRMECEADLPVMHTDLQRVVQVLANLISNAVKFTDRGEIVVSAQLLLGGTLTHQWQVPADGGVLLSVADTGIGIPAAEMGKIFDRFSQGGDPLLNKPKGTGLGLAISREIVYHYGGEIWAESEVGVGSTFYVALPIKKTV
jgi:PAS domain S-box-containing protein